MDKIKIKLTHSGKVDRNNKFDSGFDVDFNRREYEGV